MKVKRTILWSVLFVTGSGCSLLPDPDPYPSGDAGSSQLVDAVVGPDLRGLPPIDDPAFRDADLNDARSTDPVRDLGVSAPDASTPTAPPSCQEGCETSDQCNANHECVDGRCRSIDDFDICRNPDYCVAALSGWTTPCRTDVDCGDDETVVCVRVGQEGRCASVFSASGCVDPDLVEIVRLRFADEPVHASVCGQGRALCRDSLCVLRCEVDEDCVDNQRPLCDVDSGRCVCSEDSCTRNASICGPAGRCLCVGDGDCVDGPVDVCYSGQCGCSSAAICPEATHPGTQVLCQP